MFTKHLMISGLKRQDHLLKELIGELERKEGLDSDDCFLLEERAVRIAKNLSQLRRIKDQYAIHLDMLAYSD